MTAGLLVIALPSESAAVATQVPLTARHPGTPLPCLNWVDLGNQLLWAGTILPGYPKLTTQWFDVTVPAGSTGLVVGSYASWTGTRGVRHSPPSCASSGGSSSTATPTASPTTRRARPTTSRTACRAASCSVTSPPP